MNNRPTKDEILAKYRDVIDADDFEVLSGNGLPSPENVHQENASLQYVGTLNGWSVWIKRSVCGAVAVICLIGSLASGLETINKYSRLGYDKLSEYVRLGSEYCDIPATEYVAFDKPKNWPLPPDEPIYLPFEGTTTTTTTTADPNIAGNTLELSPGSGIAPNSDRWHV